MSRRKARAIAGRTSQHTRKASRRSVRNGKDRQQATASRRNLLSLGLGLLSRNASNFSGSAQPSHSASVIASPSATSPACSVSDAGPPVQRQGAALLEAEMKRAGWDTPGWPAFVWRVYFGTWEGEGSRASRYRLHRHATGTAAHEVVPGRSHGDATGSDQRA